MELICADQQLINIFKCENSLLDAVIESIEMFRDEYSVNINIRLVMRRSSDFDKVLIQFANCKEFCFSYTDDYFFYNVELIKFFQTKDGLFFASFDPFDELEVISNKDPGQSRLNYPEDAK